MEGRCTWIGKERSVYRHTGMENISSKMGRLYFEDFPL